MEQSLREQTHRIIDELSQQQLLALRMILDDMLQSAVRPSRPGESSGSPASSKRISLGEYRRAMGLSEPV